MTRPARRLIAAVIGIGLWSCGAASAAVIRLKNGNVFEGEVKSRTEQEVVVEIPDLGTVTLAAAEVASIEEVASQDAERLNEQAARRAPQAEQPPVSPRRSEIAAQPAHARTQIQRVMGMVRVKNRLLTDPLANKTLEAVIKVMSVLGVWLFVILLALAVYFAVCLQRLAERTGTGDEWMAWIPILNLYLACRVGGRPGWWLLLYPVPLLGTVIDLLVWAGIAAAREKPPWLCLFMLLPVANLILVGYLAFSKDPVSPPLSS